MINTINLLFGLHKYVLLSKALKEVIETNHRQKVITSTSLCYDTIKLKVDSITGATNNRGVLLTEPFLTCSFQISDTLVTLAEVYCQESNLNEEIRRFILDHFPENGTTWNTESTEVINSPEIVRYLSIADTIAKEAYHSNAGDDYRPGYFSEIIVQPEAQIILKQINRHNSRSIDHKEDYFMRELEFCIPLKPVSQKLSFDDETIGEMRIRFFDHSTKNNQMTGDRIRDKIKDEKSKFG